MVDARSGTLVVLGQRGRTHFFTSEGQHVSSVRYSRDAIARKLKLEQWCEASRDQLETFRRMIEAQAGLDLSYVEQLYSFGNRHRTADELHQRTP